MTAPPRNKAEVVRDAHLGLRTGLDHADVKVPELNSPRDEQPSDATERRRRLDAWLEALDAEAVRRGVRVVRISGQSVYRIWLSPKKGGAKKVA